MKLFVLTRFYNSKIYKARQHTDKLINPMVYYFYLKKGRIIMNISIQKYILLLLSITTPSIISTSVATATTPKYTNWEKEWTSIYEHNNAIIQNPIALSSYFAQVVKDHNNIGKALEQLGINLPFCFGASCSSYQVEGGIGDNNSWTIFVRSHNKIIAENAIRFWQQYIVELQEAQQKIQEWQTYGRHSPSLKYDNLIASEQERMLEQEQEALQEIQGWLAYLQTVEHNTTTTAATLWARASWEEIYGNPNMKTTGILEDLQDEAIKQEIKKATEKKKIRELVGKAIDFWHKYPEDIALMQQEFGINTMRISIEWSRVQPEQTVWDEEAIAHYKKIIQEMKKRGITPLIVLHHYTIPTWFEALGGFTQRDNIDDFVEYAARMYQALGDEVILWSTFNAVEGYAFKGYYTRDGAPGLSGSMPTTQTVIAHMLDAHVRIYRIFKKAYTERIALGESIPEPRIGIQKNVLPLDPDSWNPLSQLGARMGNYLQNHGYYSFFKDGRFSVSIPIWLGNIQYPAADEKIISDAPHCLDWIGINHYSNVHMHNFEKTKETNPERMTLNINYRFYPEGLYRAVEHIYQNLIKDLERKTGKTIPIFITENGTAVGDDEARRTLFYQRALFTIAQTIKDGYNVIGYTPWSHADNYEWGSPYGKKRYGLLYVDFQDPQLPRRVKEGARYYADFVKNFFAQFKP